MSGRLIALPPPAVLERLRNKAAEGRTLHTLNVGAGRQSTTLALMSALQLAPKEVPRYDAMIFADTGWESHSTYRHLERIRELGDDAGIPLIRASAGNIREAALNPSGHYATMPLHILGHTGGRAIMKRQCTDTFKIQPVKSANRALLGAPITSDGQVGRVPSRRHVIQAIGFSADEARRIKDGTEGQPEYSELEYPLYRLGMTAQDCVKLLTKHGLGDTSTSSCVGCPHHGNKRWRHLRDNEPENWLDAILFDESIRHGYPGAGTELRGCAYLHRSRVPLAEAPIDLVTAKEWAERQGELDHDLMAYEEDPPGCSPWGCRRTEIPVGAAVDAGA
ncbi:hypothetical protein [Nonomuraea jabiensis]|uniref:hypothetical protein n=1 Tax=Nonomuraea jabiensis TaxID=882448 RepID=UPI003D73EA9C